MMTGNTKKRLAPVMAYFIFALLLLPGCIADYEDCFVGIPLQVKRPADTPSETLKDMAIYVFDDKDLLLDILSVNSSEPVMLNYPGIPSLRCIAWGNTKGSELLVSPLKKGDPLSGGSISLKPSAPTKSQGIPSISPPDLFYGEIKVENTSTSNHIVEKEMFVSRWVASMNIIIRGLEVLTQSNEGNYSVIVHETASRIDFEGHYGGDPVSYEFSPEFEAGKDYTIPLFNLFPTLGGSGLLVDIYRNGSLLRSLSVDSSNRPMIPVVGQTLNVLINFKLDVNVQVKLTDWGKKYLWKAYS